MQFWDTIINVMMMGTDKRTIAADDQPAGLADVFVQINQNQAIDKEEKFLQFASLAFNYRQSGVVPVVKEGGLPLAPMEENRYCSTTSAQLLKDILAENTPSLLKHWLEYCNKAQQIVPPEIVPTLLAEGVKQKKLQPLISAACGKRGQWLGSFNPAWNFFTIQTDEETWHTGTLEQRKIVFQETRLQNPALAREWLLQTWPQEDANTRAVLLELMDDTVTEEDISFLESLMDDKSKKVKEQAKKLLKQIPGSGIVKSYQQILEQTVSLKKEKTLLGMLSKTILQFNLPATIDEAVFKNGIDKLSPDKNLTDTEYIVSQLIQSVPPSFWEKQLGMDSAAVIGLLQKDGTGRKMIPALVIAITRFHDSIWARAFLENSDTFYINIIPLLPEKEQDMYSNKFFDSHPDSILPQAVLRETEWSNELAKKILRYTAKNPYHYTRAFYNKHIHLLPFGIAIELERCTPAEKHLQEYWSNISEYVLHLISLKIQTIKSFNV